MLKKEGQSRLETLCDRHGVSGSGFIIIIITITINNRSLLKRGRKLACICLLTEEGSRGVCCL